jgi:hypothetical protein
VDLLDRYLTAIRRRLPLAQADDIIAELQDVLLTRQEEAARRLGRPLKGAEQEALIKDFGHPLVVAGRYRNRQYLIGPELYPFYVATLQTVLGIGAAVIIVMGASALMFAGGHAAGVLTRASSIAWSGLFTTIGVLTVVFFVMDRTGAAERLMNAWRPRDLPRFQDRPQARWERLSELVASAVFLLWWIGVIHLPVFWGPGAVGLHLQLGPVFHQLYWPVIAMIVLSMIAALVALLRPGALLLRIVLDLGVAAANLGLLVVIYRAGDWIEVTAVGWSPDALARLEAGLHHGMQALLAMIGLIWIVKAAARSWRLLKALMGDRSGTPAAAAR